MPWTRRRSGGRLSRQPAISSLSSPPFRSTLSFRSPTLARLKMARPLFTRTTANKLRLGHRAMPTDQVHESRTSASNRQFGMKVQKPMQLKSGKKLLPFFKPATAAGASGGQRSSRGSLGRPGKGLPFTSCLRRGVILSLQSGNQLTSRMTSTPRKLLQVKTGPSLAISTTAIGRKGLVRSVSAFTATGQTKMALPRSSDMTRSTASTRTLRPLPHRVNTGSSLRSTSMLPTTKPRARRICSNGGNAALVAKTKLSRPRTRPPPAPAKPRRFSLRLNPGLVHSLASAKPNKLILRSGRELDHKAKRLNIRKRSPSLVRRAVPIPSSTPPGPTVASQTAPARARPDNKTEKSKCSAGSAGRQSKMMAVAVCQQAQTQAPALPRSETIDGKAENFVADLKGVVKRFNAKHGLAFGLAASRQMRLMSPDHCHALTKKFMLKRSEFDKESGCSTTVDLGYHFTRSEHMETIQRHGLLNRRDLAAKCINPKLTGTSLGDGVYTARTTAYASGGGYGYECILVARLGGSSDHRVLSEDVMVLKDSAQCLGLVRVNWYHNCDTQRQLVQELEKELRALISRHFGSFCPSH